MVDSDHHETRLTDATVTPIDRQIATRITAAVRLRVAVTDLNNAPVTPQAVDLFRDRVLRIADFLAPPPHLVAADGGPLRSLAPEDFGH